MDFKKHHSARRKIANLMEQRQKAEAEMLIQVRRVTVHYYRQQLETVAEWLDCFSPKVTADPHEMDILNRFENFSLDEWFSSQKKLADAGSNLPKAERDVEQAQIDLNSIQGSTLFGVRNPFAKPEILAQYDRDAVTLRAAKKRLADIRQEHQTSIKDLQELVKNLMVEAMQNLGRLKQSPSVGSRITTGEAEVAGKVAYILTTHRDAELQALSDAEKCIQCLRRRYSDTDQAAARLTAAGFLLEGDHK